MSNICYSCKYFGLLDEYTGDGICRLREKKPPLFHTTIAGKDFYYFDDPFVYDTLEACKDFSKRRKKHGGKM